MCNNYFYYDDPVKYKKIHKILFDKHTNFPSSINEIIIDYAAADNIFDYSKKMNSKYEWIHNNNLNTKKLEFLYFDNKYFLDKIIKFQSYINIHYENILIDTAVMESGIRIMIFKLHNLDKIPEKIEKIRELYIDYLNNK